MNKYSFTIKKTQYEPATIVEQRLWSCKLLPIYYRLLDWHKTIDALCLVKGRAEQWLSLRVWNIKWFWVYAMTNLYFFTNQDLLFIRLCMVIAFLKDKISNRLALILKLTMGVSNTLNAKHYLWSRSSCGLVRKTENIHTGKKFLLLSLINSLWRILSAGSKSASFVQMFIV